MAELCTLVCSGLHAMSSREEEEEGGGGGMPLLHPDRRSIPHGNTPPCHLLPRARARIRGNILIKPSSFPRGSSSLSPSPPPFLSSSPLLSPQPSSCPTSLLSPHSQLSVPHRENLRRQRERERARERKMKMVENLM